ENADDHKYLQGVASKYGVYFSKPGNGICHQIHLERFAAPGKTLLGSDSHTPTAGGIGCLAMGAGGLDVACAMAGRSFQIVMPRIVNIILNNDLRLGVTSKDIILKVLQILSVKGGVGKVIEYSGDGLKHLSVPQRATITNMGAELGATTSLFPSDEITYDFLKKQDRASDYVALQADQDAFYDETYEIDLAQLEPMIAMPHSPDAVQSVESVKGLKVDQVAIGSCTNSSYSDLMSVANILKGKKVHPDVSLVISPGSRQVMKMLADQGALAVFLESGARLLESTCGPCIGMGQSPISNGLSLRTFNRNFYGRSGTLSAKVCLVSPQTAALSAINGYISNPMNVAYEIPKEVESFYIDDSMILKPTCDPNQEIVRGPNIKPLPQNSELQATIEKLVMIKVGDNITTDHIVPGGTKVLPYRSNIEKISEFTFCNVKESFHDDCLLHDGGIIIAGHNYGQGSSREHAALAPLFLGIKAVIAKSFARIHRSNLINSGILPLIFVIESDYDEIDEMDELVLTNLHQLEDSHEVLLYNKTKNKNTMLRHDLSSLEIETMYAGGTLSLIRKQNKEK
ncbi:MAG: aconitate hydratase, partial [Erysipelotrichaceae bacterium]